MGRSTFRKVITSPERIEQINPKNKKLMSRFLKDKNIVCSDKTILNYKSDLNIFFVWNLLENDNKFFVDIKKIEFSDFFAYCVDELKWSSKRFSRMKSCLSSLSDFIERIYYEEYPQFRNVILKSIQNMPNAPRRKKLILTEKQVNDLLNYLENDLHNPQEACLLALAVASGCRKSELLRIDINLIDENETAFEGLFLVTKDKIKTKGHGKDGYMLEKYIIKDIFLPYYKKWLPERKRIMEENGVKEHNKMFIRKDGQPAKVSTINGWIEKWSKFLGVDFYMHSLRHYTCTYLSKIGLEQELIVAIYGWKSSDMYNIYNDMEAKDKKWKGLDKLKEHLKK